MFSTVNLYTVFRHAGLPAWNVVPPPPPLTTDSLCACSNISALGIVAVGVVRESRKF